MPIIPYNPLPDAPPLEDKNSGDTAVSVNPSSTKEKPDITDLRERFASIGIVVKPGLFESYNFVSGTSGWQIQSDGDVEFNNGTFRGALTAATIDIGGADATSFHVDINGNLWSGAATFDTATNPFSVTSAGILRATGAIISGSLIAGEIHIPDIVTANSFHVDTTGNAWWGATAIGSATAKVLNTGAATFTTVTLSGSLDVSTSGNIKSGQTAYNTGTGWFMEYNAGTPRFSIGVSSGNFLTWDGATMTVKGVITATTATIASTTTDTFTINSDLTDANIDLVFGRTTGGNATMRYDGSTVNIDKSFTVSGTAVVVTSRQIISGGGLSGGGDFSADRTLVVGAGTLITVGADDVGITPGTTDYGFIGSTTTPWTATWLSLSQLAGAGLTHTAGVLAVGAGTLVTVGADTVGITDGSNYQFIGTSGGTAAAWVNLSTLAGAGITHTTGVLAVGAGNGIVVNADDVALDTPGTLTVSTSNSPFGSHTHAVTSSSNPGAAASLLASNASGYLQLVRLGLGVAPLYPLHIRSTTEVARWEYDITNYASFTISSGGNLVVAPTGDFVFDPTGNDIMPNTGYDLNLGSLTKKYLTLHAAELWVETLVAQNTIATIGGRILVGPTTTLTRDLTAVATTIYVKHNEMASGDRAYMEANGSVEFFAITSAPTLEVAGDYSYTVTRNLDGTGANTWTAGDAMFNTGAAGDGFIDIYSVNGVKGASEAGPTVVGNVRNSTTYNDWTSHWAIGNLNGLYGYGVTTYGVGLGEYAASKTHITIESANGFRIFNGTGTVLGQWDTSGNITVGNTASEHISISSTAVQIKDGSTVYTDLTAGVLTLGVSSTEHVVISSTSVQIIDNATVYTDLTAGALSLGDTANEHVLINTSGVALKDGATVYGLFAATTTIGVTTTEHVSISSTAVQIKDGSSVYTDLTAGVLTLGLVSGGEYATIDGTNGVKLYGGGNLNVDITNAGVLTLGLVGNSLSRVQISAGAVSGISRSGAGVDTTVFNITTAGVATIGSTASEHVSISGTAIQLKDGATVYTDLTAGVLSLGDTANEHVLVNTTGVSLKDGASIYGVFAATTTIGLTASEHVSISSTAVQIKDGSSVYTDLTAGVLTLGLVSGGEYVTVDGTNGIKLYGNAIETISISNAGVITVGEVGASKSNVQISSGQISLRTNTTNKITLDTSGNINIVGSLFVGTAGNIQSGQTAYNTGTGYFLEYNGGTPRLSIGNGGTKGLTWDGTNIAVNGQVNGLFGFGGSGADGALNVTSGTTTLNLDQEYNFTTINVSAGATLTFTGTGAVVLNATGAVTIPGTVELRNLLTTQISRATRRDNLTSGTGTGTVTLSVGGTGGNGGQGGSPGGNGGAGGTSTTASGTPGVGGAGGAAATVGTAGSGGNSSVGGGGGGGGGGGTVSAGTAGSTTATTTGAAGGAGGNGNAGSDDGGGGGGGGGGLGSGDGGNGGAGGSGTNNAGSTGGNGGVGGASGATGGNGGNGGNAGGLTSTVNPGAAGGVGGAGYTNGGNGGTGGANSSSGADGVGGVGGHGLFGTGGTGGTGAANGNGGVGGAGRTGGTGGTGGAGSGTGGVGGAGKVGAAALVIQGASSLSFTGTINAHGGAGGAGGSGGAGTGVGGAGGVGGDGSDIIILCLGSLTNSGTINNTGGAGGAGGASGGGGAGVAGSAGTSGAQIITTIYDS